MFAMYCIVDHAMNHVFNVEHPVFDGYTKRLDIDYMDVLVVVAGIINIAEFM